MTNCKLLIQKIRKLLPELASTSDLVRAGVYRTEQAACNARRSGKCPPYMRIPARGIVYPRDGVIEFLEARIVEGASGSKIANGSRTDSDRPTIDRKAKPMAR